MARAYWLEPAPAPVPPPPTYAYPTCQYAPVPMVGGQWDYGACRRSVGRVLAHLCSCCLRHGILCRGVGRRR
eukprot:3749587-Lingulodinium_polyedra.AAC.1